MVSYAAFKVIHLLGVVLFLGNIIVTALWKTLADRTGEPRVIAYAQHLVTVTDWVFTGGGLVLLLIGAYGMVATAGLNAMGSRWLVLGTESPTRLRRDLGGRTYSHSDCASTLSPWICCGRSNSRALLAPQSALAGLGDLGNVDPPGQSLCDDL